MHDIFHCNVDFYNVTNLPQEINGALMFRIKNGPDEARMGYFKIRFLVLKVKLQ